MQPMRGIARTIACMPRLTCVARSNQIARTQVLLGVVSRLQVPLNKLSCWQAGAEVTVSERDVDAARCAEAAQRLAAVASHEQRMLRQLQVTRSVASADRELQACFGF